MKTMTFNTQTSHGNKKWHSRQNTNNETQFMRCLVKLQKEEKNTSHSSKDAQPWTGDATSAFRSLYRTLICASFFFS
jgi:hypothetical protein